jgi:hypothetical protein
LDVRVSTVQMLIELTDEQRKLLEEAARPLGVKPEALAQAVIADALAGRAEDFDKAAAYVLGKNAELYLRLR